MRLSTMNTSNFRPSTPSSDLIELQPNNFNDTNTINNNNNHHQSNNNNNKHTEQNQIYQNSEIFGDGCGGAGNGGGDDQLLLTTTKVEPQQAASECGEYSDSEYLPNNPYYPSCGNDCDLGGGASGGATSDIDDDEYFDNPFDESTENHNQMAAATAMHSRLMGIPTPSFPLHHPHPHAHLQPHHPLHHAHHPHSSFHPAQSVNPYSYSMRPPSSSEFHYSYNYMPPNRRNLMGPPPPGYNSNSSNINTNSHHHQHQAAYGPVPPVPPPPPPHGPPNFWYPPSSSRGFYSSPPTASGSHLHGHHLGHYPPPPPHPSQMPPHHPHAGHYGSQHHPSHMGLHPFHHHYQSEAMYRGHHHDQMVDMLQLSNSGREARNRAEKNRRDKLNGSIQELSTMVPHVAESPRRVDKTAILRYSAHGLRVHYVFGKSIKDPPERKPQLTESLMKLLDSFHITITCHGQIVLISTTVEQHLGHCQTDLYGQNILNITHPDDQAMLRRQLIPNDLESLFDVQPEDESGEPRPRTREEEEAIDMKLKADTRSFTVRLARAGPRTEPTTYEVVRIDGCFRRADAAPRGVKSSNFPSGLQLIRRARGRDDSIPLHSISGNDIVLVAMVRVIRPPKLNTRIMEANSFEYRTRHLIDGRIIDCDQRIGLVAGYMKGEVTGLSPFTFMHQDDVRWVIVALRQMYDCKSDYGESCYRLLTRNNRFIYLQTKGFLEIDKETNKVHSFVCINTLVSDEEGRRRVQEMKNKFSIIINTKIPLSSSLDIPASENPQQLEKAVLCLIQNLQKNSEDDENDACTMNAHHVRHDSYGESGPPIGCMSPAGRAASSCSVRPTKTPPLALIPPEPATVKSSISKSVDVVAKNIRNARGLQSPHSGGGSPSPMSPLINRDENSNDSTGTNGSAGAGGGGGSNSGGGVQNRPSVLQRISRSALEEVPVKVKDEYFHSPQNRVPPLPNSTCNCFYETGGPRHDCLSCQEFALITSPPPTADAPLPRQFRSSSSSSTTTALKRGHSDVSSDGRISPATADPDDQRTSGESPKRRLIYNEAAGQDIRKVLSSSFQQINRSLNHIENATTELRGQCNNFTLPNAEKLNEICEEHQRQQKMLVSIKSEYEANLQGTPFLNSPVQSLTLNRPAEENFSQKNDLKPR